MSDTILSAALLPHAWLMHAPMVLFLLCPVFIVVGATLPPFRGRPWLLGALLLLGLGTASLFLHSPDEKPDPTLAKNPAAPAVLWICDSLTTEARIIFIGLTAIYIAVMLLPEILRQHNNRLLSTVLPLSFLVLYSAGAVFLIQTTDSAAAATEKLGVHGVANAPASDAISSPSEQERK